MPVTALPLPHSDLYSLQDTAHAGRTVRATCDIAKGSHLLATSASLSPVAHVILRPYRREVCAQCFAYDRGREWKFRSLWSVAGVVFCSDQCQSQWTAQSGELAIAACAATETTIKASSKRKAPTAPSAEDDKSPAEVCSLSSAEIDAEWERVRAIGHDIRTARATSNPSKLQQRALRLSEAYPTDPDILSFLVSGLLHTASGLPSSGLPSALLALVPDSDVFASPEALMQYTQAYLLLCAIIPIPLLPCLSTDLCIELASRASHNAFSIRPAGTSDGEQSGEFMGWGVWPEASFFNHSCAPSVIKERRGRQWFFSTAKAIGTSDELNITYLGGDEWDLQVTERRKRLHEHWGFWCQCSRCMEELRLVVE